MTISLAFESLKCKVFLRLNLLNFLWSNLINAQSLIRTHDFFLTLMRVTSGSLARCGVGVGCNTPYLSWLWSKFWSKNHVSLNAGIIYNSFDPFSEFFFQKSQKKWRKLKTYQKVAKNERKF